VVGNARWSTPAVLATVIVFAFFDAAAYCVNGDVLTAEARTGRVVN